MGHRRIAYAYETSNDNNQNMVFSAEARLHGLMETAEKRKMTAERIAIRNYEDATNTILNSLLTMDPAPTALHKPKSPTGWINPTSQTPLTRQKSQ